MTCGHDDSTINIVMDIIIIIISDTKNNWPVKLAFARYRNHKIVKLVTFLSKLG